MQDKTKLFIGGQARDSILRYKLEHEVGAQLLLQAIGEENVLSLISKDGNVLSNIYLSEISSTIQSLELDYANKLLIIKLSVGDDIECDISEIIDRLELNEEQILNLWQNIQNIVEEFNQELNNKVDKIPGKGLSTNDFTNELKDKLNEVKISAEEFPST